MPALNSSNLASADYNEETEVMTITFRSGATYSYRGVPKDTYESLISASSPGQFFSRNIRSSFVGVAE